MSRIIGAIAGSTQLLGVMGYPIKHTLSPVMHNEAIAHLGVDYVYLPFPVAPSDLGDALRGFTALGVRGFNVTIPHKQTIVPLLNEVSAIAQAVGAVNTVWRTESGWSGTNTDVHGFLSPLVDLAENLVKDWSTVTVVVLGNGGAARAVVAGCHQLGCKSICVVGRDTQKLEIFRQSWLTGPLPIHLEIYPWETLSALLPRADLLVNTTPMGMAPNVDASPVSALNLTQLPSGAIAYDLIYTPKPTQFLKDAAQGGAIVIDGLEMLVHQGAMALEHWLGQPAPVTVMRSALQRHLKLDEKVGS